MGNLRRKQARDPLPPVAVTSLAQLSWTRIIVTVLAALLAMLLAALDQTIVATALPRVVADLGGFDQFAWVFSAYMLASTTSIPMMGKLSDIYGRKWVLVGGVVVFLVGSALCGSAQDMLQLILFRGIQGLGAGSIIANSYTVVSDVFPPAQRGKWMGFVGAVFAIAVVIGPLAGGYVTDHFSWRWIFLVNLPLGFVALVMIMFGMVNLRNPEVKRSIDFRGVVTLILSVVPLLLALTWAGKELPWASPEIVGLFVLSGLMAMLFLVVERNAKEPVIPGHLYANPIFTVAVVVTFLTAVVAFTGIMFIPLFVQGVIGSSATNAGITLVPAVLSVVGSAIIAGQVISRTGHYRLLAIAGVSIMAVGAYLFTRLNAESSNGDAILYMVIGGAGFGITLPTFMIAAQNAFPHHMLGVVTASLQFFRTIGGAVGTAVLGSYLTIRLGDWLSTSPSAEAIESLPNEVVEQLHDPQTLIDPGVMSQIREQTAALDGDLAVLENVVEGLRSALAGAIHDVFLLTFGVILVAVVASLFFREIPLRKTISESEPPSRIDLSSAD